MSKSILVIDDPFCCMECPMCFQSDEISIGKFEYRKLYSCRCVPPDIEDFYLPDILNGKPDWCPLQDLPRKKMLIGFDGASNAMEIRERGRQEGFNACIDEILKGVNKNE